MNASVCIKDIVIGKIFRNGQNSKIMADLMGFSSCKMLIFIEEVIAATFLQKILQNIMSFRHISDKK